MKKGIFLSAGVETCSRKGYLDYDFEGYGLNGGIIVEPSMWAKKMLKYIKLDKIADRFGSIGGGTALNENFATACTGPEGIFPSSNSSFSTAVFLSVPSLF